MDPEVRERFERIEGTLDRVSSILMELLEDRQQLNRTLHSITGSIERLERQTAENSRQINENSKHIAENSKHIAELREAIRLSIERQPKNGHSKDG